MSGDCLPMLTQDGTTQCDAIFILYAPPRGVFYSSTVLQFVFVIVIVFISHRIHGIHRFFSLPCDACAGINAAYARGIHRDLTITNANTALAELKTFTMATAHFVTLRQGVTEYR